LKGHLWVKKFQTLLEFVITNKQKYDRAYRGLIKPITELEFSNGIDFSYNPGNRPLRFID